MVERGSLLKVSKIKEGTVIDHIEPGRGLDAFKILGISSATGKVITIAMKVPSEKMGQKDILKIEGKTLDISETNKIAVIAPRATINIIKGYRVKRKEKVQIPNIISGIIKCPNSSCISNAKREPVTSTFFKRGEDNNTSFQCYYCSQIIDSARLSESLFL